MYQLELIGRVYLKKSIKNCKSWTNKQVMELVFLKWFIVYFIKLYYTKSKYHQF